MSGEKCARRTLLRKKGITLGFFTLAVLLVITCVAPQIFFVYAYSTPTGYDDHDYQKLVGFLEQTDGIKKNGEKISTYYNPEVPTTWVGVGWNTASPKRVKSISWMSWGLVGSLDVSGFLALETLWCENHGLEELNVSGCSALTELCCRQNRLSVLDVSGLDALEYLDCRQNGLEDLNVSGCLGLQTLYCVKNNLNALDVSGLTALAYLDCSENKLIALDVSGLQALEYIDCGCNELEELNVSGCSGLIELYCYFNNLSSLDASGLDNTLKVLDCSSNGMEELNVSGCISLEWLHCEDNTLSVLNVDDLAALQGLTCGKNGLEDLNVSGLTALAYLDCSGNKLSALDVSGLQALEDINCDCNELEELNVSGCSGLMELNCYSNKLSSLDVSGLDALKYIDCDCNELEELNVSGCNSLEILSCSDNSLTFLDVSDLNALSHLFCMNNRLEELNVSGCSSLFFLSCNDNVLRVLDVSDLTALQRLDCQVNELENLTLSGCTALLNLNCSNNWLSSIELSTLTSLQRLYCSDNRLTFATLPILTLVAYEYEPQKSLQLGFNGVLAANSEIDLSLQAQVDGVDTVFFWYKDNAEEITPTTANGGKFSFGQDFIGQTIYCKMTNTKFPALTLQTTQAYLPLGVAIDLQPNNTTVPLGAGATFSVRAITNDGGALLYQWERWPNEGNAWIKVDGATGSSYTTPAVIPENSGDQYRCRVSSSNDADGSGAVFSEAATLTVVEEPSISGPEHITVTLGSTAVFEINAQTNDGGDLSYEWEYLANGASVWKKIEGVTISSYTTPAVIGANNGDQYRCQVTNTKDGVSSKAIISGAATLTVVEEPSISGPEHITVTFGSTAVFEIKAQTNDGGNLSYEWEYLANGTNVWKKIEGATISSYTTPAVTGVNNGDQYRCQVTNKKNGVASKAIVSGAATLTVVVTEPQITGHPQPVTVMLGAEATFTVTAEADGELSYQWERSTDGGDTWQKVDGAESNSYTTPAVIGANNGDQYRCQVTNTKDGVKSRASASNAAILTVQTHELAFLKPTNGGEMNINSGSLVVATIGGDLAQVKSVAIQIDGGEEELTLVPSSVIYHLLSADLAEGKHTITIRLVTEVGSVETSVTFTWQSYRRGFGFGRFDFGED